MAKDAMNETDSRLRALSAENERLKLALHEAEARIEALEKLAREDGLTGLLNRRGFELELRRALGFHARHGEDMALVLLDLDRFKEINDHYGHAGGDTVLRHVASILASNVRGSDVAARIGGDEFALILWRAGVDAGQSKIELLRQTLATQPAAMASQEIPVSVSAGCAALAAQPWSFEQWIAEADLRLYADKGRQRQAPD